MTTKIKISLIATTVEEGAIDVRYASLDPHRVESYRAALASGAKFPPITVTKKGDRYLIVDGRTRVAAARELGRDTIDAVVAVFAKPADFIYAAIAANTNDGKLVSVPPTAQDYRVCARQLFNYGVSVAQTIKNLSAIKGVDESFIGPLVKSEYNDCKRRNLLHAVDSVSEWLESDGKRGRSLDDAAKHYGLEEKIIGKAIDIRRNGTTSSAEIASQIGKQMAKTRKYCNTECKFPKDWAQVRKQAERFFEWAKAQEVSNHQK